ncbi:hypothetical protein RN001_007514 [Aquatica leii]|uniref:Uncharacterized protein n=1 Tax=Aquatica leii TaxID=1421715 RepID=A0AAN7P9M5_9COLE|nr:hypothetical protein RN001_007514 [Aquatica leii]
MAIELKLYKTDNSPWGFRLTGGADCEFPLTVVKLLFTNMESKSKKTIHSEARNIIKNVVKFFDKQKAAGDENNNLEVSNIMSSTFEHEMHTAELTDTNVRINHNSSITSITDELIAEAISGEAEVLPDQNILGVNFNKVDLSQSTILRVMEQQKQEETVELKERKWSAFLQKPQRPIVQPKSKNIEQSAAPPYQVIIKKQKKKNITVDTKIVKNVIDEPQETENIDYLETSETYNEEISNEEDNNSQTENEIVDNDREKEAEVQLSLDEQLAQVQMQLQALAQLPSSVQDTLESVTQQLTKILNATQLRIQEENVAAEEEEEYKSNASVVSDNDYSFNDKHEEELEEITDNYFENEKTLETKIDEEELERLRIETEKSVQKERVDESHQRRLEQRPTYPLAPIQRPIILPGGRKWAQPDDAMPVRKKKSGMTDEKIIETLDTYSETIIGHTKGINFLKYEPPPKNLDYLQKSDVYKLIHDMDPPPRGIATRAEIVIPEQDYYTKGK